MSMTQYVEEFCCTGEQRKRTLTSNSVGSAEDFLKRWMNNSTFIYQQNFPVESEILVEERGETCRTLFLSSRENEP